MKSLFLTHEALYSWVLGLLSLFSGVKVTKAICTALATADTGHS